MTYSTGGLIQATDLNGFISTTAGGNINAVLSSYGQTALSTVAAGALVSATQWAGLNGTVSSLAAHQGTAITSRTSPVAGGVIGVLTALGTDITALNTNVLNAALVGTQYTGWTGTTSKTTTTGSGGTPWTLTWTHDIAFADTTSATNFFNCGGLIKIQFSKTSTGTTEDTQWNTFIGNGAGGIVAGSVVLSGDGASKTIVGTTYTGTSRFGGSGIPSVLATTTGFNQLTTTPVMIYEQLDAAGAYSGNYVKIFASVTGSTITLTTTWFDDGSTGDATISGGTATTGATFGTAPTTLVTYTPPETTYLTNSWGTPTITASVA